MPTSHLAQGVSMILKGGSDMNKADRIKRKLIKEVVIPSLIGVLIALFFLLAVVKPTGASEDSTRPITGRVYFVSGRSVVLCQDLVQVKRGCKNSCVYGK